MDTATEAVPGNPPPALKPTPPKTLPPHWWPVKLEARFPPVLVRDLRQAINPSRELRLQPTLPRR